MATLKNLTINDTGFIQLPAGTTAQRPGTAVSGMMRWNTDYNRNEIYDGTAWVLTQGSNYATGGTVSTAGGYRIHTFTTTGATSFTMTYPGTVEVLLVGAGGGGCGIGGGGGAGGFVYESQVQMGAGTYTVNVGTGGGGEPSHNTGASPGTPSNITGPAFTRLQAVGGGRGLSYTNYPVSMQPTGYGGSGGGGPGGHGNPGGGPTGGAHNQGPMGHGASPVNFWHEGPLLGTQTSTGLDHISLADGPSAGGGGIKGQGHPGGGGAHGGGFYWTSNTVTHMGGGGGGAGSHGQPGFLSTSRAAGGSGLASQISGTVTYYAGGGGGGTHGPGAMGHYGLGNGDAGVGGGGVGGGPGVNGGTGGTNTGGGGGGGHYSSPNASGPGGPGIVVIKYRDV